MRFYPLEKLINLHDNYTRHFKIDHRQLLLIQRRGELSVRLRPQAAWRQHTDQCVLATILMSTSAKYLLNEFPLDLQW